MYFFNTLFIICKVNNFRWKIPVNNVENYVENTP